MSRSALILALLLICLLAAPPTAAEQVGHWTLDEGSGATASDSTVHANHGVLQETSGSWGTGVYAGASLFPSSNHVILIPDSPSLSPTSQITIAAWLRPNRQSTQYVIKKADHNDVDGFELSLSSSTGTAFVRFNQASLGNTYKIPSTSLYPSDGTRWMHVAATFDGSEIRLYIDGVLENTVSAPDLVLGDNALPLAIGAEYTGSAPFDGGIDDVQIFDTALGAGDILSVMNGLPLGPDSDGDGISDAGDAFPLDPTEWADADADGLGDNADLDDDNDGMPDSWETTYSFDPNDPADASLDSDSDGATNLAEFQAGSDPRDNPSVLEVGSWSFDDGAGSVALDGSGLGNHGAFSGAPLWVTGFYGSALDFDGNTDRVVIPDDDSFDMDVAITIAAWIRSTRDGTQYIVKKARNGEVDGFELSLSSSANTAFVRFNQVSLGNLYKVHATTPYPNDGVTWMHVAGTYDGSDIRVYVNGFLENTQPAPGLVIGSNDLDLLIGGQDDDEGSFKGSIDDVQLYDFALSEAEVGLLMAGLPLILDSDGDGVADELDDFPADPAEWLDSDSDGVGNNADPDDDDDGMPDAWELVYGFDPLDAADASLDADSDGISNVDEYIAGSHPFDSDGDGVANAADAFPLDPSEWSDVDGDGTGDNSDLDDDNDGVADLADAFPLDATETTDTDGDGIGDNADLDDDGDGMSDSWEDAYGFDPRDAADATLDADSDGQTNLAEYVAGSHPRDTDGDGVGDAQDVFPFDPTEWSDLDGDGVGDNADADDDDDGMPDAWEALYGLAPLDASDAASDLDGDGVSNLDEFLQGTNPAEHDGYTEIGIWGFDEVAGSLVADASGLGNDGTTSGSAPFVPGAFGNAIDLGSSGDYVTVPHHETLDVSGEMTAAAWIRPTEYQTQFIVRKADNKDRDGFELSLSGSSETAFVRFNQSTAGNTYKIFAASPYPIDGSWMHVAASFDGSDIRVYVNGVLETTSPAPGLVIGTSTVPLMIGAEFDGSRPFTGSIDDVRLYDRALSDAEMLLVYAGLPVLVDTDGDGFADDIDTFPEDPTEWEDTDGDGTGNNADLDDDGDGMPDVWELTYGLNPLDAADAALDLDGDGASNLTEFGAGTHPWDGDNDGVADADDAFPLDPSEWSDIDADGTGDNADLDDDNDGVADATDAFPLDASEWEDTDGDGAGNNADLDDDGDGMPDAWEVLYGFDPVDASDAALDADGDGVSNLAEYTAGSHPVDSDADGVGDAEDIFPLDPTEWLDSDGDGTGDNADLDDDDDGMPDSWELTYGFDPRDAADAVADADGDELINRDEYLQGTDPRVHNGYTEVAIWGMEEATGTLVGDTSDLGNHAGFAPTPTLPTWSSGRFGGGLYFDGSGARVVAPDADTLDLADAFSVTVWIRPEQQETQHLINKAYYNHNDGFEVSLSGSSGVAFLRVNQATSGNTYKLLATTPYPFDGATWMHIAATFDGAELRIYTDGVLEGSLAAPGLLIPIGTDPVTLGAEFDGDTGFLGSMDDARLYDRALTEAEIQLVLAGQSVLPDSDSDGVTDDVDAFPEDPSEWEDTDADGVGDNTDLDDDGDGMPDSFEVSYGFDPRDAADAALDADADGSTNLAEYLAGTHPLDFDNDGVSDADDAFPLDPSEWSDVDADGTGDNADLDDDNDGVNDLSDAFPLDVTEWSDNDLDGLGDNADLDDDGDGIPDTWETQYGLDPLDAADASIDSDGDGTDNLGEFLAGTHPFDTDNDGVGDTTDAFPLDPAEWADTDLDGLGDNADLDDDGDQMPDAWEELYGFDPKNPADAFGDPDADGVINRAEYLGTTNPLEHNGYTEVGIWNMDDGLGSVLGDASGLGNDGAFGAAVTTPTWIPGRFGSGLYFDGATASVVIPDADTLDVSDGFTAALWARPEQAETQHLFNKAHYNNSDGIELSLSGSSGLAFVRVNQATSGNAYKLFATSPYPTDGVTWMHIAATFDGAELRFYVNGLLESTLAAPGLLIPIGDDPITLGTEQDGDNPYLGGMDEARLYDRALSPAEIDLVYQGLPLLPDSDGDGVYDPFDAFPGDAAEWSDTDGDGLGNNADTDDDGDGMPDSWELLHGFDPLMAGDAPLDADGDGFSNLAEYLAGTHPVDQDGDGVGDAEDAFPLDATEWDDVDLDGIGSNADLDDDGDGMPDLWEFAQGFDARVAADAAADSDGDGLSNLGEFLAGTDPHLNVGIYQVGHWQFNELGGATALDESGFANHGSLIGGTDYVLGRFLTGLDFSVPGDRVEIPDSATLDLASHFTSMLWVRPNTEATQYLLKKAITGVSDGYEIGLSAGGGAFLRLNQATSGNLYRVDSLADYPFDGTSWIHLAASYDGSDLKIYVNGVLDGTLNAPGLAIGQNALPLILGGQPDGSSSLDGSLDAVRLYDEALSAAEIAYLMSIDVVLDGDGDGVDDAVDAFPYDPAEAEDTDGDGIGNNADLDDDGDGMPDTYELLYSLDPLDAADGAADTDGDGMSNSDEYTAGTDPRDDIVYGNAGTWYFEEGTGITALDSSPYANDAVLIGSPQWIQGAIDLPNATDRALVATHPSLDMTDAITLAAWIRPNASGDQVVISKSQAFAIDGYELGLASNGEVFVRFNHASSGSFYELRSSGVYPTNGGTWMHIAATFDGSSVSLYINGVLDTSMSAPGLLIGRNSLSLSIGAEADGARAFDGAVDHVAVYDIALLSSEITTLMGAEDIPDLETWTSTDLVDAPTSLFSGEKPQSKVWYYAGLWWGVWPDTSGTWLRRLDGNTWTSVLLLSTNDGVQADYVLDEGTGLVHMMLFDDNQSRLVSAEYVVGSPPTYQLWSERPGSVDPGVGSSAETATLAMDSTGRLWLCYDGSSSIRVRYSDADSLYASWSSVITIASGVKSDDIGMVVAFDGKVGTFWSNQDTDRFGFRVHDDGDDPQVWSGDETPASQSAVDVGAGMADDHMNVAVGSDGTLYFAIKTSYGSSSQPKIGVLVRRPNGSWDDIYDVDTSGTRPIIALNEMNRQVIVMYTRTESGGSIKYRLASIDDLQFGSRLTLIDGELNNVQSTKQNFVDELIAIAASTNSGSNKQMQTVSFAP